MPKEIQYSIALIGLGASLVLFAHNNFATKKEVDSMTNMIQRIDNRVYDIVKHYGLNKK